LLHKIPVYSQASNGDWWKMDATIKIWKMIKKGGHYSVIATIIPASILSVVILISTVHYNAAEAQGSPKKLKTTIAIACGKELLKQCSGVPVQANNMLECLQKSHLSARCAALAHNVVRMCDRDAAQFCQYVVAGQGNILGCLTTARGVVSSRCNAALDAAFLRQ